MPCCDQSNVWKLYSAVEFVSVIETCHCQGRESVSDSISGIEALASMWFGLCTHYIDDRLSYEPLKLCQLFH